MSAPAIPSNLVVQTGNLRNLITWNNVAGATSYDVQRSTDGVNFSSIGTASVNSYVDLVVVINTQYFYKVASVNGSGTSGYTSALSVIPTLPGQISLGELRQRVLEKADKLNSPFITTNEVNFRINRFKDEFYDMLITAYEDYFVAPRVTFQTDGSSQQYPVPNGQNLGGVSPLYKLYGVDLGLDSSTNAWVTIKKFSFIQRNRYVYPQITSTFLGVFNMRYRLVGQNIMFIPTPSGGQTVGLWYFPRPPYLLQDTDSMDGFSGWDEYVICRTAKYILDKEETPTEELDKEILFLKQRIEQVSQDRDSGQGDTISQTRTRAEQWGGYGGPGYDGSGGGW